VLIEQGLVAVDGRTVTSRRMALREGSTLEVQLPDDATTGVPVGEPDVLFDVVHVEDDFIIVDKPAGLVVHPGAGHDAGTLVHGLVARFPDLIDLPGLVAGDPARPGIVHRLDRGTSGLLVVARTPVAYDDLIAQLAERRAARTYRALVLGEVASTSGVVDAPIGRSVTSPTRMAVSRKGKEARTRYRVIERFDSPVPTTLIEASLETGRTHQIRVHLSAIGHPVVGDETYGRGRSLPDALIERPFLHARALAFDHPVSGDRVGWESALPEDLVRQLEALAP
jgi:23S rRNA pseudouridine1911/1915/1917 synthase